MNTRRTLLTLIVAAATALGAGIAAAAPAETIDTERPGAPRFVGEGAPLGSSSPTFWFSRSTDDTGIVAYEVWVNGVMTATVPEASTRRPDDPVHDPARMRAVVVSDLADGDRWVQLVGVDTAGNRSVKSAPVRHRVDTRGPSAPTIVGHTVRTGFDGFTAVDVSYTLQSRADVESCRLLRNLRATFFDVVTPGAGDGPHIATDGGYAVDILPGNVWWYQVVCADVSGNESVRSAPERVDLTGVTPAG